MVIAVWAGRGDIIYPTWECNLIYDRSEAVWGENAYHGCNVSEIYQKSS